MSDTYFTEVLGVPADATREQIRQAYRLRVMENHPDRFPPERKPLQELATIALTEAYNALMSGAADRVPGEKTTGESARRVRKRQGAAPAPENPPVAALALPRDPAYAWYKQGFINFSLAIHGIAAVNRKIAAGRTLPSRRRFNTAEYFGTSLAYLRAAHGYFTRVVEDYAGSVWVADSRFKLRRIEGLTAIYRRILRNLRLR
ncbi:MAG: J domain-containing protein [Spirochaetia bacterium]